MTRWLRPTLLIWGFLQMGFFVQAQGRLSGVVKDAQTKMSVEGVFVQISPNQGFVTDSTGRFHLDPAVASVVVTFNHIGYMPLAWHGVIRRDTTIAVELIPISHQMAAVEVSKNISDRKNSNQQIRSVDMQRVVPVMGERNIDMLLQQKAGVVHAQEINPGLYVRGFSSAQNRTILNGTSIFNASHLLGIFPSFNSRMISKTTLYTDDANLRYGNYLSSCLVMESSDQQASSPVVEAGVGLLTSQLFVRTPIKKQRLTASVGARYSYFNIISESYNRINNFEDKSKMLPIYGFYDLNGSLVYEADSSNRILLDLYASSDHLNQAGSYLSIISKWGNKAGSLRWIHRMSPSLKVISSVGYSYYGTNTTVEKTQKSIIKNGVGRLSANVEAIYAPNSDFYLDAGAFFESTKTTIDSKAANLNGDEAFLSQMDGTSRYYGAYFSASQILFQRLKLSAGVRAETYRNGRTYFLPRLMAEESLASGLTLFASVSRRLQSDHLYAPMGLNLPIDMVIPSKDTLPPQEARQVGLGFSWRVSPSLQVVVDGYYAILKNQVDFINPDPLFQGFYFTTGRGITKGLEFTATYSSSAVSGELSYSISQTRRQFNAINGGDWFSPPYDIRHKLDLSGHINLSPTWSLAVAQFVQSGNIVTVPISIYYNQETNQFVPIYDRRYNLRLPLMHRLDISVQHTVKLASFEMRYSFGLYNAYNHANPYFIYFKPIYSDDGSVSLVARKKSLLPMIPFFMLEVTL